MVTDHASLYAAHHLPSGAERRGHRLGLGVSQLPGRLPHHGFRLHARLRRLHGVVSAVGGDPLWGGGDQARATPADQRVTRHSMLGASMSDNSFYTQKSDLDPPRLWAGGVT